MGSAKVNGFVLSDDRAVSGWLENGHTSEEGRGVSSRLFGYWYDWLQEEGNSSLRGLSPTDLLKEQKRLNRGYMNDEILLPEMKLILYEVLRFLGSSPDWRTGYKRRIYGTVRSFFTYNLGPGKFPKPSNGEKGKLKGRSRVHKNLTVEVLRDMIYKSNVMYRAVWSCMFSTGMGIGEAVKWSDAGIGELREALAKPVRVDRVEMVEIYLGPRKMNLEMDFYSYVSGSALEYLKAWVKHRDRLEERPKAPKPFPDAIFVGNTYNPLNRQAAQVYWTSKLKQLGFWESTGQRSARTNLNLHQIRDVFKTRCHKASAFNGADLPLADYFMGHKSEKYDYDHVHMDRDFRVGQYLLFQPWLDVKRIEIEGQRGDVADLKARIEELEAQLEREQRRRQLRDDQIKSLEWRYENLERLIGMALVDERGVPLQNRMAEMAKAFKDRDKNKTGA